MEPVRQLTQDILAYDFAKCKSPADFIRHFYEETLTIDHLAKVHELVHASSVNIGGRSIGSALSIGPKGKDKPLMVIAQLHGNEPAGLAGHLLVMALAEAKLLTREVLLVIGNPLASSQYFSAYAQAPRARQEIRDAYRCGLSEEGELLPDMNRIPTDFMERKEAGYHISRAQELFHLGNHVAGVLDIHSARGNMLCITDHKHNSELKNSPIRAVLLELAEAIGAHSSNAKVQLRTLKTILASLSNIEYQVGIEAGRHEAEDSPLYASMFTQSFLHAIGASKATPYTNKKETGEFECYYVQPKWTYNDLRISGTFGRDDKIYMVRPCASDDAIPKRADRVIVKKDDGALQVQTVMQYIVQPAGKLAYTTYQYDEMEVLAEGQVVAVAVPSGVELAAPASRAGIFFSKSAALYDKDPSVGPWPLPAELIGEVKFCYPCEIKHEKLTF